MRSIWLILALGLTLLFTTIGCNKKPADTASDNSANPPASGNLDNSGANAGMSPAQGANVANTSPVRRESRSEEPPQRVAAIVPAGTTLSVRLDQALGSKLSQTGQAFSGALAEDVVVGGDRIVPRGATVNGNILDAKPLGRFAGGAVLSLRLTSVSIHGRDVAIATSVRSFTAKGKGKRTGIMTGGGAALGAIIGGIAGGGKGAAIGAVAGGGAGAGGAAFTGNKDIVLPVESTLAFKLMAPLEVK